MQKLQLTLTEQEMTTLENIAKRDWGRDSAWYVKYLIAKEVESKKNTFPVYKMSESQEMLISQAIKDDEKGISVNWDKFSSDEN